jgi:glutamate carboxypeptidase
MGVERYLGMPLDTAAERVLARSRVYVEHETPSGSAAAIRGLATLIQQDLEAIGARVEMIDVPDAGANLVATVDGAEPELAPVLAMAHIDTVHPVGSLAARPFSISDGRAYGPGIYDMKTGLAIVIEALAWLHERGERPRRTVQLLVTCDEEVGSESGRLLIARYAPRAAAVLVPEPSNPDGGVKTSRKGVATYRIEATGRAAHAGIDGAGAISATTELVHALSAALALADHDRGTTINPGIIGGGTASNVVAAEAWAVVDVRIAEPTEGERVHNAMLSLRPRRDEATLTVRRTENRGPLVRTPDVIALYQHAAGLAAELGIELAEGGTGGGSDGSLAAEYGAAVLDGLGARGGGAHAVDEHVVIADLPFRLALVARLLETL